jgi:hypothetical protein
MRSHSGKDESRDNLHDPTLRDHPHNQIQKAMKRKADTTKLGSASRKRGASGAKD